MATVEKQKKPRSQAQIDSFEKARARRAENLKKKQDEKNKKESPPPADKVIDDKVENEIKTAVQPVDKKQMNPFQKASKPILTINKKVKPELEVEYVKGDPPKKMPRKQPVKKAVPEPEPEPEQDEDDDMIDLNAWLEQESEDDEPEIVVKKKPIVKPKPKVKPKKKKIIYQEETESDEEIEIVKVPRKKKTPAPKPQPAPKNNLDNLTFRDKLRLRGF